MYDCQGIIGNPVWVGRRSPHQKLFYYWITSVLWNSEHSGGGSKIEWGLPEGKQCVRGLEATRKNGGIISEHCRCRRWSREFSQVTEWLCSLQSVLFCSVCKELAGRVCLGSLTMPSDLERGLWRLGSFISMLDVFAEGIYRCSSEVMTAYEGNDGFITQMASFCVQWFSWHVKVSRYIAVN